MGMRRILRWMSLITLLLLIVFSVVSAIPPLQETVLQRTLSELRSNLELLADRIVGGGARPDEWKANTDFLSASMLADLWFDNELLADQIFGRGLRPLDWIGASSSNPDLVARNIRHDMELAADRSIGLDLRPDNWIPGPRLFRCSRTLMNTIYLLDFEYNVRPQTDEAVRVYCPAIEDEVEDSLLDQALQQPAIANDTLPSLVLSVRGDLERLADESLGVNNRPPGWLDNTIVDSPTLAQDVFTDLERLADIVLEPGVRPGGWIGTLQFSPIASFRNLRHDLELLADIRLGEGNRPRGWQGDSELFRCEPLLQGFVFLVEKAYNFTVPNISATSRVDYCAQVERAANFLVENPPRDEETGEVIGLTEEVDERYLAESQIAFAYLDLAATQYLGMMPRGVEFRAWYRNFSPSNMMFVSGEDFAVYIDRRWTTMPQNLFNTLPTLEGVIPLTFCDATWCNGPGPTPTPTGSGPIIEILLGNTTPIASQVEITPDADTGEKLLVTWNHLRVNYILQRPDVGRVQVTLEICREPNQLVCEPVLSVFDTSTNQAVASSSQTAGLNVYELPYGYSTQFIIEGLAYYSRDIWLNDPTLTEP